MKKLWEATYVIGETSKWANAHPDRANARYGWEKAIVLEIVVSGHFGKSDSTSSLTVL